MIIILPFREDGADLHAIVEEDKEDFCNDLLVDDDSSTYESQDEDDEDDTENFWDELIMFTHSIAKVTAHTFKHIDWYIWHLITKSFNIMEQFESYHDKSIAYKKFNVWTEYILIDSVVLCSKGHRANHFWSETLSHLMEQNCWHLLQ